MRFWETLFVACIRMSVTSCLSGGWSLVTARFRRWKRKSSLCARCWQPRRGTVASWRGSWAFPPWRAWSKTCPGVGMTCRSPMRECPLRLLEGALSPGGEVCPLEAASSWPWILTSNQIWIWFTQSLGSACMVLKGGEHASCPSRDWQKTMFQGLNWREYKLGA